VLKITVAVLAPLQTSWLEGGSAWAVGLTAIVNVFPVPMQLTDPFEKVGTTVIVAVIGIVPLFVAIKDIFPVLLAERPIPGFELVHE